MSSLFLDSGVVVSLAGAHNPRQVYRALGGAVTRLPLVVLVDRFSASSAEIVAAALQDNQRATLVGERTFGKALVQSIDPLDNGAALELTIARYTTPAGHNISGVGVVPAIHAVDDPRTRPRRGARDGARACSPARRASHLVDTVAPWRGGISGRSGPAGATATSGASAARGSRSPS